MKRLSPILLIAFLVIDSSSYGQDEKNYSRIDKMIVFGEYDKAADTCRQILDSDSKNADIWYKLGIASQNLLPDTASFNCFLKAMQLQPENKLYKFSVAKGYFNKGRSHKAKPLLEELSSSDSLNWNYAYYLSSLYMEEGSLAKALRIYMPFYKADPKNYVILDKIGFVELRNGDFESAIKYYSRSLRLNPDNTDAVRNLSFLYPYSGKTDSSLILLDKYIGRDPEDIDLLARRATINYSKHYNKRALNDYVKILSLGDSSFLYLKRAGICYVNNLQHQKGLELLLKATVIDTMDYETIDYIAQCYFRSDQPDKSIYYYKKVLDILDPLAQQLGITHLNLGQKLQAVNKHREALTNYQRSYELTHNPSLLMLIANVYDENLNNATRAISNYRQFLSAIREKGGTYSADYLDSVKARIEYLEEKQSETKKNVPVPRANRGIQNQ